MSATALLPTPTSPLAIALLLLALPSLSTPGPAVAAHAPGPATIACPGSTPRVGGEGGGESDASLTAQPTGPAARHSVFFCMDATTWTRDHGAVPGSSSSTLGRLFPGNVAMFTPGLGTSAIKQVATPELDALLGDADHDGLFGEVPGGGLDALGVRRPGGTAPGPITPQLVFSTRLDWGECQPGLPEVGVGALDGSLFGVDRHPVTGAPRVRHLLVEKLVLRALGQPAWPESDVDIDAFTQDDDGNIYLSFRDDEWLGDTLLADDGVVCLPASDFATNADGEVWFMAEACAVIVLDKARTDAIVKAAGVKAPDGKAVNTLGDLQALAIDPEGGRFEPVQPVPGLPEGVPNLFLNGTRLGPVVIGTRDGGRVATLGDWPLGTSPLHGGPLGLDPVDSATSQADLAGLLVLPRRTPTPMIDGDHLGIDVVYGNEQLVYLFGGFRPGAWAWVQAGAAMPGKGGALTAMPSETGVPYAWRLVPNPAVGWPLAMDGNGRARLDMVLGAKIPVAFLAVLQAYEVGSGRLSAPATTWLY